MELSTPGRSLSSTYHGACVYSMDTKIPEINQPAAGGPEHADRHILVMACRNQQPLTSVLKCYLESRESLEKQKDYCFLE